MHTAGAVLLAAAAILATPGAVSASARADKTLRLRQDTPVTAASRAGGTCPVPADKDGWHFTLAEAPQNVEFRSVTVTFDNGGTWTSGAAGRDAYVASERGASLTAATAVVDGSLLALPLVRHFDLAGTCPGQAPPPAPAPAPVLPVEEQPPGEGRPPVAPPPQDGDQQSGEDEPQPADPKPKDDDQKPSASPSPAVSATDATPLPKIGDGPDQPRLHVNTDEGATPVPAAADEPSDGLGVPGFALLALGVFLLVFGGAAGFLTFRRRGA
ncbi:hypothetical protein GCM10009550_42290 [Actinocorallia libanotica]|uniref:Gram-positive cocci surface proteins LPxTG domain-containing protein n=1 Tax=Actinocorallia libanotica TaxID=46162 RepID=A0ABN1RFQ3_9ACTN